MISFRIGSIAEAAEAFNFLKPFMPTEQMADLTEMLETENKSFVFDKLSELTTTIINMPKTHETDGQYDNAIVYLHYFLGGYHAFITEKDMIEDEQNQAMGWATFGNGYGELGYISIMELLENNVEIDLYWTPKALTEAKKSVGCK